MYLRNLHRAQLEFRQESQEHPSQARRRGHPMFGAELPAVSRPGAAGSGEFGGGEVLLQRDEEIDMGLMLEVDLV